MSGKRMEPDFHGKKSNAGKRVKNVASKLPEKEPESDICAKETEPDLPEKKEEAYVYIAECADGSWYTGWTTDPARRLAAHNGGKGAKYTRSRLPVHLVFLELCEGKRSAMRREYAIKKLTRQQKEWLVEHGKNILSDG